MKYALLVYSEPGSHDLPQAELNQVFSEYVALRDEPGYVDSAQLHPPEMATTIRERDGQTLTTDGPFADTKEVFGGFYVFDVEDADAALGIAKRIPALRLGGSVEVRPLMEAGS
ncbi:MAG TPA: YciI family protein [Solirubrobacteraceae bacterium]|jgi:hypothetical protein